jgi:hypothetical protein
LLPGTVHLICKDALCRILGYGHDAWSTMVKMARDNIPPLHGLSGQAGNKFDATADEILNDYFTEVLKLAQPRATLVIRCLVNDEVRTELRLDDDDIVELPSHMSKQSLYDRMLEKLGWMASQRSLSASLLKEEINKKRLHGLLSNVTGLRITQSCLLLVLGRMSAINAMCVLTQVWHQKDYCCGQRRCN